MNKRVIISLVLVALMGFGTAIGTYAWFRDSAESTQNTFTSGRLDISLTGDGDSNVINLGTIDKLAPGDDTLEASITLKNDGNLDLAFIGGLQLVGSEEQKALAKKLVIKKMSIVSIPKTGSAKAPYSETFILDGVGAGPYADAYNNPKYYGYDAFNNVTGKITLADWVGMGSGVTGVQNGFWKSALKPGWGWKYTFQFTFDGSAGNELQNTQLGIKFVSQAAQVKSEAVAEALKALDLPYSSTYIEIDRLQNTINAQD